MKHESCMFIVYLFIVYKIDWPNHKRDNYSIGLHFLNVSVPHYRLSSCLLNVQVEWYDIGVIQFWGVQLTNRINKCSDAWKEHQCDTGADLCGHQLLTHRTTEELLTLCSGDQILEDMTFMSLAFWWWRKISHAWMIIVKCSLL